jgi:DNA recombination protein RmuC
VLANVLPPHVYETQYGFKDGKIVDAIIKLDKKRILPIDSKFSLENYNRLIEAKDKVQKEALIKVFKADLKNRIDETAKYIRPSENTLDYAFMFIPSEAIYYDLLVNNVGSTGTSSRDLIEYAFVDKKVIIVSPTTLLAYLQTVMQGLKSLQIEEQAKDIQKRVGELGKHLQAQETFMQKLGNSLGTTVNHFNTAHKELGKIDKDIVRIADVSPGVEPLLVDKPIQDE